MSIFSKFGMAWTGLQTMVLYCALLIFAIIAWKFYLYFDNNLASTKEDLRKAQENVLQLEQQNQTLSLANTLLKKTRRLAVISNITCDNPGNPQNGKTTFTFTEINSQNEPIGKEKTFTIQGQFLYIDTQIIKFEDSLIESGDALKGVSLCFFRRLFSEKQKPEDGFPIDFIGEEPQGYASDSSDRHNYEKHLWDLFWKLAQDPTLAKSMGVRAAHGSAPYQMLIPGNTYKLELRSTGELTFSIDTAVLEK